MEKQGSGKVFMYLPVEFSTDPGVWTAGGMRVL